MPSYKLTYFDIRGRAELSRYIFTIAGEKFEDCRVKGEDWPGFKPKTPFGSMPLLEVDGKVLAQGNAIARFLARKFGLVGRNSWEEAQCDQYMELLVDLFNEIIKTVFEKDEAKKVEAQKKLNEETFPKFMSWLETGLTNNGSGWLVGNKLTVADLIVFAGFDSPMMQNPDLMNRYPKLKAHRANIAAKLSNYLKNRKPTDL